MIPNPDIEFFKPYIGKSAYILLRLHVIYLNNIQYTGDRTYQYNFKFNYLNPLTWLYLLLHAFVLSPCFILHQIFTRDITSFTTFKYCVESCYKVVLPSSELYVRVKRR